MSEGEYNQIPGVDQVHEYIETMRDIMHSTSRGSRNFVRYVEKHGRTIPRFLGKEFFLPGAYTEWSEESDTGHVYINRERRYSALYRPLGLEAAKLGALESDSVRIKHSSGDVYQTLRSLYRIEWNDIVGVFVSQQRQFEIISQVDGDAEVLPRIEFDAPDKLVFEHARNHENLSYEEGWQPLTSLDMERLIFRTDEYRNALTGGQL